MQKKFHKSKYFAEIHLKRNGCVFFLFWNTPRVDEGDGAFQIATLGLGPDPTSSNREEGERSQNFGSS